MNIKKDFKTGNTTNSFSHNILTIHTFDFQILPYFPSFMTKIKEE